jgi:hypothetical protein
VSRVLSQVGQYSSWCSLFPESSLSGDNITLSLNFLHFHEVIDAQLFTEPSNTTLRGVGRQSIPTFTLSWKVEPGIVAGVESIETSIIKYDLDIAVKGGIPSFMVAAAKREFIKIFLHDLSVECAVKKGNE